MKKVHKMEAEEIPFIMPYYNIKENFAIKINMQIRFPPSTLPIKITQGKASISYLIET